MQPTRHPGRERSSSAAVKAQIAHALWLSAGTVRIHLQDNLREAFRRVEMLRAGSRPRIQRCSSLRHLGAERQKASPCSTQSSSVPPPGSGLDVECVLDHRLRGGRDLLVSGCVWMVAVVGKVVRLVVRVVGTLEGSP